MTVFKSWRCVSIVWGQIDDKISCCGSGGLCISVWFSCMRSWPCVSVLFTSKILDEIAEHGIKIYQLPDADSDEDEEFKEQTRILKVRDTQLMSAVNMSNTTICLVWGQITLSPCYLYFPNLKPLVQSEDPLTCIFFFQASIPFAVIGSNQLIEVKGKKIRGRLYPWGVVEVENPEHNDFLKLRTMLVWV